MVSFSLCPLKICNIFIKKNTLKMKKVATLSFKKGECKLIKGLVRTTLRIDNNLKTRIELLAIKNNLSFNKMLIYLIELGYNSYMDKFDKYYEEQNKILKSESEKDE